MTTETSDDGTDGSAIPFATGRLYHGTRDQLRPGDLIAPGGAAGENGGSGSSFVHVSPDLDAAIWDAELATGDAPPRVYVVKTDGPIVDASELVAGKMLSHPSMSWRASGEVRVESEVTEWTHYHEMRVERRPGDLLVPGKLARRLAESGIALPRISHGAVGPIAAGSPETEAAASLAAALREGPLTILALGPLTNIAAALREDPALSDRVERGRGYGPPPRPSFSSEGKGSGLLFGHGPVFSDLNFRKDPAAVRYLLSTDVPLTLIPYEAARDVLLTPAEMEQLAASGPAGAWIARGARGWMEIWRTEVGLDGFYPFDLVAARFVMEPSDFFCAAAAARVERDGAGVALADRQRAIAESG